MYRKFIGITMQHLTNKYIASIFIAVFLISCSHIAHFVHDEDQTSEDSDENIYSEANPPPRKKNYKQIYCTPEDEKRGIKTTIDFLNVPCGLSKIKPIKNRSLELQRIVSGVESVHGANILLGHHLLLLKSGDKVLQKIQVEKEGYDPFWKEVLFVKIRKGIYWQDLNNDGYPEFSVLKTDTGYSSHRTVDIYTLKDNSFHFYGHGVYVWTTGEHVLLNCPRDCGHHNHDECKKCT